MNKEEDQDAPFIFVVSYYLIASVLYAVMGGVYFLSISSVDPPFKFYYIIGTLSLLLAAVYVTIRYPEYN